MRKLVLIGVVVLGAVPFVPLGAGEKDAPFVREPAVAVDERGAPTVTFRVAPSFADHTIAVARSWRVDETVRSRSTREVPLGGRVRVALTGPDDEVPPPSTNVRYEIGVVDSDTLAVEPLGSFELRTLPARGSRALRFCVLGDSGFAFPGDLVACGPQVAVANAIAATDPDLVVHTGDIVYPKGNLERLDPLFFQPYKKTLARVPFFPSLGNHDFSTDKGAPSLANYPYPPNPNGNRYYSFDAANAHFVALDSNELKRMTSPNELFATAQGRWLKEDLASARAAWKIVYFHHPLYSASHGRIAEYGRMRAALEDLFLDSGVDLVLNGHDHYYLRTRRIARGAPDPNGIVHFVSGGGGAPLYKLDAIDEDITAKSAKAFHFVRFSIKGSSLDFEAVAAPEGKPVQIIDSGTITARGVR